MKHAFAIMLFLLFCAAANAEPMATTIDRYVRSLGVDGNETILTGNNMNYAKTVSKNSGMGDESLLTFGKIGYDNVKLIVSYGEKNPRL